MAKDRRVDILSSYTPPRVIFVPPIEIQGEVPLVSRIVTREWSRFRCANTARPPRSGGEAAWKEINETLQGLLRAAQGGATAFVWGTEDKKARKTQMIPANHTVNRVDMHMSSHHNVELFADCEFWHLYVDYQWGPRQPRITVNAHDSHSKNSRTIRSKTTTKLVERAVADISPVLFPPDPSKR
jgi:hypothetical protein